MITIRKEQLSIFLKKIVDFLPSEITISEDSYWLIDSDEWTNFHTEVTPTVGSLNDDWHYLSQLVSEDNEVSCSDLDRVSSILRAISQEINPI